MKEFIDLAKSLGMDALVEAPIPIIHCPHCGEVLVPEEDLPVKLPDIDDYQPSGDGQSPLAKVKSWVNVAIHRVGLSLGRATTLGTSYIHP